MLMHMAARKNDRSQATWCSSVLTLHLRACSHARVIVLQPRSGDRTERVASKRCKLTSSKHVGMYL